MPSTCLVFQQRLELWISAELFPAVIVIHFERISERKTFRGPTLTECQLLERATRRLWKHEIDKHDLEGIPYTVAIIT